MARVDLIVCENCGAEVVETQQVRASMTQLVVTQGGSRSHVYDLCPNCASGLTAELSENPADWPRFVAREAVQHWLRRRQVSLGPVTAGNTWDDPERRAKERAEADGDFRHVRRPTEYGDGIDPSEDVNTPEGGDPEGYH